MSRNNFLVKYVFQILLRVEWSETLNEEYKAYGFFKLLLLHRKKEKPYRGWSIYRIAALSNADLLVQFVSFRLVPSAHCTLVHSLSRSACNAIQSMNEAVLNYNETRYIVFEKREFAFALN